MPRKDEIDRMIVLFYHSRNSSGYTNYTRSIDWLDGFPMEGLDEMKAMFENFAAEVSAEMDQRIADGMPRYSRKWYDHLESERKGGAEILAGIGVTVKNPDTIKGAE